MFRRRMAVCVLRVRMAYVSLAFLSVCKLTKIQQYVAHIIELQVLTDQTRRQDLHEPVDLNDNRLLCGCGCVGHWFPLVGW